MEKKKNENTRERKKEYLSVNIHLSSRVNLERLGKKKEKEKKSQ